MKAIGVIPARLGSTRLDEKVLVKIAGKPMIEHVWRRASKSTKLEKVIIACDDKRIIETAEGFGAEALLTSKDHISGSDRIAEAVANIEADIIVNIQGDEPLIEASIIDDLVTTLEGSDAPMATVIKDFVASDDVNDPNVVKATIDDQGFASSFTRKPPEGDTKAFKHLGIYAYRKDFLLAFTQLEKSENEINEKLEQLRALDAGYKIKTIKTDIETISVDTAQDLEKVKRMIESHG